MRFHDPSGRQNTYGDTLQVNLLSAGGNYGWDPVPGYDEGVPMTDRVKFPDAIEAKWSSGNPTLATSGGIFIQGEAWGPCEGRLAVATLITQSLRVFDFAADGTFVSQVVAPELDGAYGRLRTPMMGPDGALYVTTSNGSGDDKILRVTPANLGPRFPSSETGERSVRENTPAGRSIGDPFQATDEEGDPLTCSLDSAGGAVFDIDETTGQLRTRAPLDRETQDTYRLTVSVSDGRARDGSADAAVDDTVEVTVTVTDENEPPELTGPSEITVTEHSGVELEAYRADDPERARLNWTLSGTDAADFRISLDGLLSFRSVFDRFLDALDTLGYEWLGLSRWTCGGAASLSESSVPQRRPSGHLATQWVLCYSHGMPSGAARWLEELPLESFFRASDVPGRSRSAARSFLNREIHKKPPRILRVAPNLYWKARPPSRYTGRVHPPSPRLIGWEIAGPHAAALGWYGANLVGWSDQIALQYVEFAVPGEPKQRNPHPRVTIRSRRNLSRRELSRLEATYLEAVIGFDRWCEIDWGKALNLTLFRLEQRTENGDDLPRSKVFEVVAANEHPKHHGDLFRSRAADLVAVMAESEQRV